MTSSALVDVVCVAYGASPDLECAIRSVLASASVKSVALVDHGAPGVEEIAAVTGAVWLPDPSNPGFGVGQNRGAAIGTSPYVLILNPDCIMQPGALEHGLDYLAARPDVGLVQGVIRRELDGTPERSQGVEPGPVHLWGRALGLRRLLSVGAFRRLLTRSQRLSDHVDRVPPGPTEVRQLAATAVLARRSALTSVGGFDDRYFLYGEDLDLCRRLGIAGWKLVALPFEWGRHVGGQSSGSWQARELVWWEGTMQFAARWWSRPAFVLGMGAAAVRLLQLAVRSPSSAATNARRLLIAPVRARRRGRSTSVSASTA